MEILTWKDSPSIEMEPGKDSDSPWHSSHNLTVDHPAGSHHWGPFY